jgi:hypothetical protein
MNVLNLQFHEIKPPKQTVGTPSSGCENVFP